MLFQKNQPLTIFITGLIFFLLDCILKYLFNHQVIPDSFLFSYTQNLGIAFGLPLPKVFLICIICLSLIILISWLLNSYQAKQHLLTFSIWLIILGAVSNLIDRLKFGFVIDYINLQFWPVFNLADMMIVVGIALLMIKYIFQKPKSSN